MNILIVVAHPEPQSFNGSLTTLAVEVLRGDGHSVEISDLYRIGFAATAGPADSVAELRDPDYYRVDREQTFAHENGTVAPGPSVLVDPLTRATGRFTTE